MGKVILFQGDSVTDCGRSREENIQPNQGLGAGYPMLVAARLLADHPEADYTVINRGVSGNRVVDLYARWKIDAINLQPDLLSILIGVNDTWHEKARRNGVEVPRYERIFRELLEWTSQELPGCKIVLCEPFVLNFGAAEQSWVDEMAERGKVVEKLAAEFGAIYISFQKVIDAAAKRATPELILADGVHPRLAGHQALADAWIKAVSAAGVL